MSGSLVLAIAAVLLLFFVLSRGRTDRKSGAAHVNLDTATQEDIKALLMAGRKIDAIKVYRRLYGADLRTAKEAVERLAKDLPPPPIR
jgi:ribosomal protein L7/L12